MSKYRTINTDLETFEFIQDLAIKEQRAINRQLKIIVDDFKKKPQIDDDMNLDNKIFDDMIEDEKRRHSETASFYLPKYMKGVPEEMHCDYTPQVIINLINEIRLQFIFEKYPENLVNKKLMTVLQAQPNTNNDQHDNEEVDR